MGNINRRLEKLEKISRAPEETERVRVIWKQLDGSYKFKGNIYKTEEEMPEPQYGSLTFILPCKVPKGYMGHMMGKQ